MTALAAVAIALAIALPSTVFLFLRFIRDLTDAWRLTEAGLLNRIQAPEVTVAQELTKADDYEPVVLPHDENTYWKEVEHLQLVPEDAA